MANKVFISFFLICTIIFSLASTAFAIEPTTTTQYAVIETTLDRADALKEMGLFAGTDKGYELEALPTRTQAIVFLLRMLGEEKTAQNSDYTCPFTDVPGWAYKYVAYAYNKGYTSGTGKTTFGANDLTTPAQFVTFMLRALGYSDKNGDFIWSESVKKAEELDILPAGKYTANGPFNRGDCVDIIYYVLGAKKKGSDITLAESLVASGAIDTAIAEKYGFYKPAPQYETVRIEVKRDATGKSIIYGKDAINKVPGAKYVTINWSDDIQLDDYISAYSIDDYETMMNPNKDANTLDYITNNWVTLDIYTQFKKDVRIIMAVYDNNANMLAAGIAIAEKVIDDGYMDLVLIFVDGAELIAKQKADFEAAFGNPVEYKNAITTMEKVLAKLIYISKKTGEVVREVIEGEGPTDEEYVPTPNYRFVINKEKYPELAEKVKYIGEGIIPPGKTAIEAIRDDCLFAFKYRPDFDGTFAGTDIKEFGYFSNSWTRKPSEWNNKRYILFADSDKKLIGYTTIIPSQLKIVDVGMIERTVYVD